jgi:hypothetical protein
MSNTLWVSVGARGDEPATARELEQVRDGLEATFDSDTKIIVTADRIDTLDEEAAKDIAQDLVDVLEQ